MHSEVLDKELTIRTLVGGQGPPLLLLHGRPYGPRLPGPTDDQSTGYPQTGWIWNKVVDRLAQHRRVIVTDLRGGSCVSVPPHLANYRSRLRSELQAARQRVARRIQQARDGQ